MIILKIDYYSKMEEEDLKCGLCLDFFVAPVRSTTCGHNFCQKCLTQLVESSEAIWLCPECRTDQIDGPKELTRNFFWSESLKYSEKKLNLLERKLVKRTVRSKNCVF